MSARICEALTGRRCSHEEHGWSTMPSRSELDLAEAVGKLRAERDEARRQLAEAQVLLDRWVGRAAVAAAVEEQQ